MKTVFMHHVLVFLGAPLNQTVIYKQRCVIYFNHKRNVKRQSFSPSVARKEDILGGIREPIIG